MCWSCPCHLGGCFLFSNNCRISILFPEVLVCKDKVLFMWGCSNTHANEWWMWQTFLYKCVSMSKCAEAPLPQFVYRSKFILMKHQWWKIAAEGCCASTLTQGSSLSSIGINETGTNGLIYVVDSNDRDRIEDAREAKSPPDGSGFRVSGSQQNDPSINGGSGKMAGYFWKVTILLEIYIYLFKLNYDYGRKSTESMLLLE